MIETIEIAPDILAASLAKYLESQVDDFVSVDKYGDLLPSIDEHALRKLIQKFLLTGNPRDDHEQ